MYHVSHQGQQFGPYSVEQINQYLAQGVLDSSTFVWDQNASGWMEIGQLPGVILPTHQAQPSPVIPAIPRQNVAVQQESDAAPGAGEKKKTQGAKRKKTNEEKLKIIKSVAMFVIAGVLVYFLLIPFGVSVLDEEKPPAAFGIEIGVPRYMSALLTAVIFAWVVICVTYPFRKEKKGKKGE